MNDFLVQHGKRCDDDAFATRRSISILDALATSVPDGLLSSSGAISRSLYESIRIEEDALRSESSDLASKSAIVRRLEDEVEAVRRSISEVVSRRRELIEVDIPHHESLVSCGTSEIDEVVSRHVRDNSKIAKELCLHALLTNVKWIYGGGGENALVGEVSIPEKAVHRRFVIDRGDGGSVSEYEIAERLWETIGG